MKAHFEPLSTVKIKLTVELEPQEFKKEELKALKNISRTAQLPGFRKGKAPESTIKKIFADRIRSEAVSNLVDTSYTQAVRDLKIWPVDDPDIQIQKFEEDGTLIFEAAIEVRPEVVAKDYKDLPLKKEKITVDDAAVDARLDAIRQQHGTFEPVADDYKAANGDMAVIDFVGKLDGVPFEGGSAEGHTLLLGSGRMIPGFEEGIIGATNGQALTISVTFPDQYHAGHLAGKSADFDITVKEIKKRVLPELDDEFAKTVAKEENLAAMRARLVEALENEQKNRVEHELRNDLITALLAANEFEVPESLVRRQREHSIERMSYDLSARGVDPKLAGLDSPAFLAEAEKAALRSVRWAFLSDAIAKAEGLEVANEEVEARIAAIAAADGRPVASIRAFFQQEGNMESLRNSLREQKTMDHVLGLAKVEEVDSEALAAWRAQ